MRVPRDVDNLHLHEFIGLKLRVLNSTNPTYVGKEGIVIDETKNTIVIDAGGEKKVIAKKGSVFEFYVNDKRVIIDGSTIVFRPHERTKKLWNKRWST